MSLMSLINITGEGCVVNGVIQEGVFRIGDPVKLLRNGVVAGADETP